MPVKNKIKNSSTTPKAGRPPLKVVSQSPMSYLVALTTTKYFEFGGREMVLMDLFGK